MQGEKTRFTKHSHVSLSTATEYYNDMLIVAIQLRYNKKYLCVGVLLISEAVIRKIGHPNHDVVKKINHYLLLNKLENYLSNFLI